MLHYTVVFIVLAIIAAALGFGGLADGAATIAQCLFIGFVIIALITGVKHLMSKAS